MIYSTKIVILSLFWRESFPWHLCASLSAVYNISLVQIYARESVEMIDIQKGRCHRYYVDDTEVVNGGR